MQSISDDSFEQDVLQSDQPVLVDFWAEWCGPCKALTPVLESVAGTHSSKVKFTKMNVDDNQDTPAKYGIRGIPTLIIFKNGEVLATRVGGASKAQLEAFIDTHL